MDNFIQGLVIKDFDDANLAGTGQSSSCTLILTEGTAAKSLVSVGLSTSSIDKNKFGLYALKNPLINVRKAIESHAKGNKEVVEITKILGLDFLKTYDSVNEFNSLRYGKVLILANRDEGGSQFKGLVINLFHFYWPHLVQRRFIQQFIIPYVKVSRKDFVKYFFSLETFHEWFKNYSFSEYNVKFLKSLNTCTQEEMKSFFSNFAKYCVDFIYSSEEDDKAIEIVFKKNMESERKSWLHNSLHEPAIYADNIDSITYKDFFDKEYLFFSDLKNIRSIPHVMDGFTRSERKIVYTCLKKDMYEEISLMKVIGSTIECTSYNQSIESLGQNIISLAQNFTGRNNINILDPIGQFGTRLYGGKDSAKPKYLHTKLNEVCKQLFNEDDNYILSQTIDDSLSTEPNYLLPIIPLILVNGAIGIGSGWQTKILNYNPLDVIRNIYRMIDNLEPLKLTPKFKNFKGTVKELGLNKFCISGILKQCEPNLIEISELPVFTWTQTYKEEVLQPLMKDSPASPRSVIKYQEYHTNNNIRYLITLNDNLKDKSTEELYEIFQLNKVISLNIVAYTYNGAIENFGTPENVLEYFFKYRLKKYECRREYIIKKLQEKLKELSTINCNIRKDNNVVSFENPNTNERISITREIRTAECPSGTFSKLVHSTVSESKYLFDVWKYADNIFQSLSSDLKNTAKELETVQNTTACIMWKKELEVLETLLNENSTSDEITIPHLLTSTPKSNNQSAGANNLSESFADMRI